MKDPDLSCSHALGFRGLGLKAPRGSIMFSGFRVWGCLGFRVVWGLGFGFRV